MLWILMCFLEVPVSTFARCRGRVAAAASPAAAVLCKLMTFSQAKPQWSENQLLHYPKNKINLDKRK